MLPDVNPRSVQFQFTPLREGRRRTSPGCRRGVYFNSRPCVRGDGQYRAAVLAESNFNSRPCVRGDLIDAGASYQGTISIHAPA